MFAVLVFFRKHLESGETQVVRRVVEETITDFLQLPPEVRDQLVRKGAARGDLNEKVDDLLGRLELEAQG